MLLQIAHKEMAFSPYPLPCFMSLVSFYTLWKHQKTFGFNFLAEQNGCYTDFSYCLETDVRLVQRLSHTWTLPLELNANGSWQLLSCNNWMWSPDTGKYVCRCFDNLIRIGTFSDYWGLLNTVIITLQLWFCIGCT